MEKELIILSIYINVKGLSKREAEEKIYQFSEKCNNMYDDTNKNVKILWIPVVDQNSKVECVYPPSPILNISNENELLNIYNHLVDGKNDEASELLNKYKILVNDKNDEMSVIIKNIEQIIKNREY